ncbi:Oxysterol-binding protein [Toxoplasma gondii FOU]|uniref:Oxysterol-binding protein n=1 Tax=Toxoplasma gondii FOU TaxID=943167 RepID=A0A086KDE5_TOXGO|nr:Oxysterol-binding protein [Toxoplasma gondii FOU]
MMSPESGAGARVRPLASPSPEGSESSSRRASASVPGPPSPGSPTSTAPRSARSRVSPQADDKEAAPDSRKDKDTGKQAEQDLQDESHKTLTSHAAGSKRDPPRRQVRTQLDASDKPQQMRKH